MKDRTTGNVYAVALEAIGRGWAIIPVHGIDPTGTCTCGGRCDPETTAGKHPIRRGWTEGAPLSAADAYAIWEEEYPYANLGVRTGSVSGFLAVDVDPESGGLEGLAALEAEHGPLPRTRTHRTGSGGFHKLFKMPGFPVRNSVKKLAPGVDIRADGGQIVLPPSVSAKGRYTVEDDCDIVDAPEWLRESLRVTDPSPDTETVVVEDLPDRADLDPAEQERVQRYAESALDQAATDYLEAPPGRGNHTLFTSACQMLEIVQSPWNTLTTRDVFERLERARVQRKALHQYPGGGQEPEEFSKTFMSARGQVIGQGRPLPPDPHAGLQFDWTPEVGSAPAPAGETTNASPGPWSPEGEAAVSALLAKLLDREALDEIPPPKPLIRDLLDLDSESWIIGGPGSFKSFVALDWAIHVALGLPWRGHQVTQGRVLYVVAEGKKGIPQRVRAWERVYGRRMDNVLILPEPVQIKGEGSRESGRPGREWAVLVEAARRLEPVFVVLDTQARISLGIKENDNTEMGMVIAAVAALRQATGACVLVVHHTGRDGRDARGASALDGAQDTEIRVDRPMGRTDRAALTAVIRIDKQKDGDETKEWAIEMERVDLGTAPDGRPLSSLAIKPAGPFESAPPAPAKPWVDNLTENQGIVLAAMREHGDRDGATPATILRWIKQRAEEGHGRAIRETSRDSALRDLVKKGVVVKIGAARYALQEHLDEDPLD